MFYSLGLFPIAALVLYGALLNILALRRRWSVLERAYAFYLASVLCSTFTLALTLGNWPDSYINRVIAQISFDTQVAVALFLFLLALVFLQFDDHGLYFLLVGVVLFIGMVIAGQSEFTVTLPLGTRSAGDIAFALGISLMAFFYGFVAFMTLQQYRRFQSPLHHNRLLYLALALAGQVISTLVNLVGGQSAQPLAVAFQSLGILILAYAVLRHHLADLYYLIRQIINYALLAGLTIVIYLASLQLSAQLFNEGALRQESGALLVAATALALVYQPLRDVLQRVLDATLFGNRHNYQQVVQEYSQRIGSLQDLDTFAVDALALLKSALGARTGTFLLTTPDDTGYVVQPLLDGESFHLAADDPLIQEFMAQRSHILQYDIDLHPRFRTLPESTRVALQKQHAEVWVAIFSQDAIVGIWAVGPKASGERYTEQDLALLATLADQTAVALQNARLEAERRAQENEKHQLYEAFQRYVAPSVVRHLLADPRHSALGGERQFVTILFADLQGFSSLAEQLPPKELVQVLNGYLALAADTILEYEGTLDKFMGDGLMAIFNAPILQADHGRRAARAALAIQRRAVTHAESLPVSQRLAFRVGIHTGEAVVGNIGGAELMNYTAVGDTVNIAKRLEENAEPGQVLISQDTFALVATMVKARPLEPLQVKGRVQLIKTFEIGKL